jgi:hypothetical protein
MRKNMKNKVLKITGFNLFLIFIIFIYSFAGAPKIISVQVVPSNPGYGDLVNVIVTACVNKYTDAYIDIAFSSSSTRQVVGAAGQVFVVSNAGVDVARVNPNITGYDIGYVFVASDNTSTNNCTDCGGDTNSRTITKTFVVHVPDAYFFTSCGESGTLYLHVGMKDSYMGKTDWTGLTACQSFSSTGWTMPIPAKDFTITKSVEGTLQAAGDLLLYKINYSYQNGTGFRIVEDIPANFTVVSYGPTSIPGGSVNPGPPLTWNFPDMAGQPGIKSGTVWVLVQWNGSGSGPFTNTATGSWAGSNPKTSSVTTSVGDAAFKIRKSQSVDQIMTGSTITYYLSYEVNGYQLVNFQGFDNATGPYSGGQAPPGWKAISSNGQYGTWTVEDPCNVGDKFITGASTEYPGLLLDDGSSSNSSDQFCEGMIIADVYIQPSTNYPGADAQVVIRNNGLTGNDSRSYGVVVSIDNAPSPGYFMLQRCSGSGCSYPAGGLPAIGAPVAGVWYSVRIMVTNEGSGQRFQAKIWPRGEAEPTNWDINYLDTTAYSSDFDCRGSGTYNDWRPGVNEQSGDYDDVKDSYDNFEVYKPRISDSAYVEDDVPPNVTYQNCAGCTGPPPHWNLPNQPFQSGSFTWWGVVSGCDRITNTAKIHGTSDVISNPVYLDVLCWTPTYTPTNTTTGIPPPTWTPTDTFTNTATNTATNTRTNTPTNTITNTFTITFTNTPTSTNTNTNTPTNTNTNTPTNTPTNTYTHTSTNTITNTFTNTDTNTPTNTVTNTRTDTPTNTATNTDTPTGTPPPTWTPTNTPTNTNTFTSTNTPTNTNTVTNTSTNTATNTDTPTGTPPPTWTPTNTPTNTNTFTNTNTPTNTYTVTNTNTPTNTRTNTNTPTDTPTNTNTFQPTSTNTNTPTNTPTRTNTPTNTFTYTNTNTFTFTNTLTNTATNTNTPTNTPTFTETFTPTYTPTRTATPTITMTLPPFPYIIKIGIYNSAGELVKTVAEKRASDVVGEIKLIKDGNEVNYVNAGAMVEIQIPGVETPDNIGNGMSVFYWYGTNDGGQNVDNGVYYIKVEERDGYGHTNVVIKDISVINVEEYVEVNIFNSAGEKVKTIKENKYFMPEKINLKINDMIILEKTGGEVVVRYGEEPDAYMIWDGKNSKGEIVSNGTYEIQVVTRTSEGKLKYASKTVIILNEATEEIIKEVKAIPNPVYRACAKNKFLMKKFFKMI